MLHQYSCLDRVELFMCNVCVFEVIGDRCVERSSGGPHRCSQFSLVFPFNSTSLLIVGLLCVRHRGCRGYLFGAEDLKGWFWFVWLFLNCDCFDEMIDSLFVIGAFSCR